MADPVIVVRPAIGSGTAGVLPQNAFSAAGAPSNPSNPANPTTPSNPTPPSGPTVFSSVGFNGGATTSDIDGKLGMLREYPMPWGNPYCEVVDSSSRNLASLMAPSYYPGAGTNTPAIMFNPKGIGIYKIVVSCGQSKQSHSPAVQFNLTIS